MNEMFGSYLLLYPNGVESEAMLLRDILLEAPIHRAEERKPSIEVVEIELAGKVPTFLIEAKKKLSDSDSNTVIFYDPRGSISLIQVCRNFAQNCPQKHIIYISEFKISRQLVKGENITFIFLENFQSLTGQITKAVQDWSTNETLKRLEARDEFLGTPPD